MAHTEEVGLYSGGNEESLKGFSRTISDLCELLTGCQVELALKGGKMGRMVLNQGAFAITWREMGRTKLGWSIGKREKVNVLKEELVGLGKKREGIVKIGPGLLVQQLCHG